MKIIAGAILIILFIFFSISTFGIGGIAILAGIWLLLAIAKGK